LQQLITAMRTGQGGQYGLHKVASHPNDEEAISAVMMCLDTLYSSQLNIRDERGLTPLHYAAMSGNKKLFNVLYQLGADPNIPNLNGVTPLHLLSEASFTTPLQQQLTALSEERKQ